MKRGFCRRKGGEKGGVNPDLTYPVLEIPPFADFRLVLRVDLLPHGDDQLPDFLLV